MLVAPVKIRAEVNARAAARTINGRKRFATPPPLPAHFKLAFCPRNAVNQLFALRKILLSWAMLSRAVELSDPLPSVSVHDVG
jgi:hypothetical protein